MGKNDKRRKTAQGVVARVQNAENERNNSENLCTMSKNRGDNRTGLSDVYMLMKDKLRRLQKMPKSVKL